MTLVLDASVMIAWSMAEKDLPYAEKVMARLGAEGAYVPALWHLEISNILLLKERKGLVSARFVAETLRDVALLPIVTDEETVRHAHGDTLGLARQYRLTTYDAAYLELAMRRRLALASLDAELNAAALAAGVEIVSAT